MNEANITYQQQRHEHTRRKFDGLRIPTLKGKSYLDMGCNSGMFCQFAVEAKASKVFGIDIAPDLIDLARENVPEAEFAISRFEDIDLGTRRFDVISIASAIHYSLDFVKVANIIMNMLNDDGLLVIEGGLFDPMGNSALNTPIPGWRKVGDHCRQLSLNFVTEVLFPNCTVAMVNPSLNQGGDNLARYVLHVSKSATAKHQPSQKTTAKLDLEAFIRGLAVSFDTIDPKYPISQHMEQIKLAALMGPGAYERHLSSSDLPGLIAKEISYCTSDWATDIEVIDCYDSNISRKIAASL